MLLARLGMGAVAVAMMMLFLDAASADIKVGNRSQLSQNGAGATSTARPLKATVATSGRPQTLVFKIGRFVISPSRH